MDNIRLFDYGDPMRIPAQIFEHLLGTGKRTFGIRDPFELGNCSNQMVEGFPRIYRLPVLPGKISWFFLMSGF